jgi:rhomboid protease GluP
MNYSSPSSADLPPDGTQQPPPGRMMSVSLPNVRPLVTYTLIGLSLLLFMAQFGSQFLFGYDYVAALGVKANDQILQGEVWRFFTPMFLHGSILHIGFNMYALYIIGPTLERLYGHQRYLGLYILSGIAGNICSFVFTPNPSLGSSTAIFGLLGAEAIFLYRNREIFGNAAQRGLMRIISIAMVNLVIGLSPGIDNWGHIGGLVGGTLFAWLAGPILRVEGIFPSLSLVDTRESRDVVVAAMLLSGLLVLLAGGMIFIRGG